MSERSSATPHSGAGASQGVGDVGLDRRESTGDTEKLEDGEIFDVEGHLSGVSEDPNQVNIHQFYPELKHNFMKATDIDLQTDKAPTDTVEEDESPLGSQTDPSQMQLVTRGSFDTLPPTWSKEDENNSSDPQKLKAAENGVASVFATALDERMMEKVSHRRATQGSIFQPEHWGMEKPYQPSMSEIMTETATLHFEKAMSLKDENDHQGVIIWINKAIGVRGENVRYFVERAEAYLRLGDFKSAILNYKKVCLLEPSDEEYYHRLAFLYYFQGQSLFDQRLYPEALESFSQAAEMRPDNVGYHIRSIACLAALQRHGECLALVNKRLEIDRENTELYIMRARLHEMFRNTTLCYYDVKDALNLTPDHAEASRMMDNLQTLAQNNKQQAQQLSLMGKNREALQKISIAIETDPSIAEFHVLRGALHRKLGDFNAAIDDFLLALDKCDHNEESPVYTDSQRQLLLTYNDFSVECFTKGFYEEAIILLNKAIKGEKQEKGLYINRGDCFFRQDEFNFALQDYHQALELDNHDETVKSRISVIHNEFGVNAYQEKLFMEAEGKFSLAIEFHPKVGQYYISRARSRYMLENMPGARGDLMMGLLLDPANEDVISILSRLFPGKSVGDVLGSRAAEAAKHAIKDIFHTQRPARQEQEEPSDAETDERPQSKGSARSSSDTGSEVSEEASATFAMPEPMWRPGGGLPTLKSMMADREFNVRLVTIKQEVKTKVKGALLDRKTLKYDGPRMQPLPPPAPKPAYGGRGIRREKLIPGVGRQKSGGWRQFSMGVGLAEN